MQIEKLYPKEGLGMKKVRQYIVKTQNNFQINLYTQNVAVML